MYFQVSGDTVLAHAASRLVFWDTRRKYCCALDRTFRGNASTRVFACIARSSCKASAYEGNKQFALLSEDALQMVWATRLR